MYKVVLVQRDMKEAEKHPYSGDVLLPLRRYKMSDGVPWAPIDWEEVVAAEYPTQEAAEEAAKDWEFVAAVDDEPWVDFVTVVVGPDGLTADPYVGTGLIVLDSADVA